MRAKLPAHYAYLANEPDPCILKEALKCYGVKETQGPGNTPEIMRWASIIGDKVDKVYTADSIPWCGLFMAYVAKRSGCELPASPLWARAWASWGQQAVTPKLGDVLVFGRGGGGGHVGLYVAESVSYFHVLGGNQGDAVSIVLVRKARLLASRRTEGSTAPNVRRIRLTTAGAPVSVNEA